MEKKDIYNKMPISVQNMLCSIKGFQIKHTRYGKGFWKLLEEFESHNNWNYEQLCEYRDAKLRHIITHSYETVPYYNRVFKKNGMSPNDIKTVADLKYLPRLNKQIVNENPNDFISSEVSKYKRVALHTSGTTGTGYKFISTFESVQAQWATFWRHRRKLGIRYGSWCASFGSQLIVPATQESPPFWRIDIPGRRVYFSAFHENNENLKCYYQEICRQKMTWIHGFPSLLNLLAVYMNENNLSFSQKIDYVTTGAENLLDYQKESMWKAFGVVPIQVYGQAENVAIFSQEEDGRIFVDEDFAAVEFLPNNIGTFDVVGTNLWNYAMPHIRWETRDTVTLCEADSTKQRQILSIDGRLEDYISLPNGTRVGKLDHCFKDTINIKEAQLYQHEDYSIDVLVVGNQSKCIADEIVVKSLLERSLNQLVPIRFIYVDSIRRTTGGKIRFVISEV